MKNNTPKVSFGDFLGELKKLDLYSIVCLWSTAKIGTEDIESKFSVNQLEVILEMDEQMDVMVSEINENESIQ